LEPGGQSFSSSGSSAFEEYTLDLMDDVAIVDIAGHFYLITSRLEVFQLRLSRSQRRAIVIGQSYSLHSLLNCYSNQSFPGLATGYVDVLVHDRSIPVYEGPPTNHAMLFLGLTTVSLFAIFFIALCFICKCLCLCVWGAWLHIQLHTL